MIDVQYGSFPTHHLDFPSLIGVEVCDNYIQRKHRVLSDPSIMKWYWEQWEVKYIIFSKKF